MGSLRKMGSESFFSIRHSRILKLTLTPFIPLANAARTFHELSRKDEGGRRKDDPRGAE